MNDTFGARLARAMFKDRKGHGGGPCTRRVLSEKDLTNLLQAAYEQGFKQGTVDRASLLDWLLDHLPELDVITTDPTYKDADKTVGGARHLGSVKLQAEHYPWAPGERAELVAQLWKLIKRRTPEIADQM